MSKVLIGSARSSYGNTSPGDQNGGREVSTENWYLHSKGWVVIRAKDPEARERIAVAMERACANNDIGYDQSTRLTLFNDVKADVAELLHRDPSGIEEALDLLMIAKYLERIGDHAVNIAEWVVYAITGLYKGEVLR